MSREGKDWVVERVLNFKSIFHDVTSKNILWKAVIAVATVLSSGNS